MSPEAQRGLPPSTLLRPLHNNRILSRAQGLSRIAGAAARDCSPPAFLRLNPAANAFSPFAAFATRTSCGSLFSDSALSAFVRPDLSP